MTNSTNNGQNTMLPDKTKQFEIALNTRDFEIKLFWQRSNYFLVLNTAIATAVLLKLDDKALAIILSVFGLLVSLLWVGVNLGSKFWQTRWEYKLAAIEESIDKDMRLFKTTKKEVKAEVKRFLKENKATGNKLVKVFKAPFILMGVILDCLVLMKFSVSKIMITLSFLFVVFHGSLTYHILQYTLAYKAIPA